MVQKERWHQNIPFPVTVLALLNILIHLFFANTLGYHRDELLYFALGLHPDVGYATVPPLIGWIAFSMQQLAGFSVVAVKLFPALLSGILVWISAWIARELGGGSYAQLLTAIGIVIMPVSLRAFHLFQPVPIDLVLWTLVFYYVLRYINTAQDKYLIVLGGLFGLGMLNKYLIALLLLALLVSIIFTKHRNVFRKKAFYLGLALGLLVFLPNLLWQLKKGLPVINHMQELEATQLVNVNRFVFLTDQLTMTFASSILMIIGILYLAKNKDYRIAVYSTLVVVTSLLLLRGKSYYTIGVMPLLVAAGAVAFEKYIKKRWIRWSFPSLLIVITLPIVPFGIPIYGQDGMIRYFKNLEENHGLLLGRRFEDGSIHSLPQDYADQLGWEELAQLVNSAYQQIPEKEKSAIYCENYGQAAAVAVIGRNYGLPEPLSFNESFRYWAPKTFDPDIAYFIYVNDELGEDVAELFQEIRVVGQVSNIHAREYGTTVYLCSHPKSSFNIFWKNVLIRMGIE